MSSMPEPLHPVARGLAAPAGSLASYPPVERWDDWETYDAAAWPKKVKRRFALIPTICFNCEAACGLLAYVDKSTGLPARSVLSTRIEEPRSTGKRPPRKISAPLAAASAANQPRIDADRRTSLTLGM